MLGELRGPPKPTRVAPGRREDDPRAADEAVTGQVAVGELRAVALMSNGASRTGP